MISKEDLAIDVVNDYLVELLQKKNWCRARSVGNALEALIQGRQAGGVNYTLPLTPDNGYINTY